MPTPRADRYLPGGTVTFLFTDIEGSTRLWETQHAAMQQALAHHDAILRDAIEAHDGYLVKTTGDGAHAAFAISADAIAACLAAQRALKDHAWGELSIKSRMALHSGTAEQRGGDYYGPALNRTARLMEAAHGGQGGCEDDNAVAGRCDRTRLHMHANPCLARCRRTYG